MPTADYILVVDAGTSSLRTVVVDARDGAARTVGRFPWPLFVPEDAAPFGREFDATAIERGLRRLIADAAEAGRFGAVAVTGQREALVMLDERGEVLLASPNIDARAAAEGIAIDATQGNAVYEATGHLPSLLLAPAKLAWMREHRPDEATRVTCVLPLVDWLAALLTGSRQMSRSLGVEVGLLRYRDAAPAPAMPRSPGYPAALLAPVIGEDTIAGNIAHGSLAGTPVVHAGADTQCALAGMGVAHAGQCGVPAGWSAPLQLATDQPVLDRERRTWTGVHVVPGRWILESSALDTGRAWEWLLSIMSIDQAEAEALAAKAAPGSGDTLGVLGARAMNAGRMTAGLGALTVPLPLVMSSPERADLLRCVIESTVYAMRANLEQLEEVSGARIAELRIGGGMSRSGLFAQTVADVLDRPVRVARSPETSAVGAACLAATAVGGHATLDAALAAMAEPERVLLPDPARSATYDDCFARWSFMADAFERLGAEA